MTIQICTRGPQRGQCNICGQFGPLTEDHTPPKGWMKPTQVMLKHISHHLGAGPDLKGRHSQNGVKYRTLCARCNNNLGAHCDPALIEFVDQVGRCIMSEIHLPDVMKVRTQPQAVMRSVIGHLSAQGVDRYLKGAETEAVRDYILNPALPLPAGIHVYYWLYPYRPFVLFRDAAYADLRSGAQVVAMWLVKAFPMAFLVTWKGTMPTDEPVMELSAWRNAPFNTQAELPLRLRPLVLPTWPEAPTMTSIPVYGQEAITLVQAKRNKPKAAFRP